MQHENDKIMLCLQFSRNDIEFYSFQILQLHSHGEQDRMKARMTRGSVISIPLSYPMDVRLLDSGAPSGNYTAGWFWIDACAEHRRGVSGIYKF